MFKITLRTQRYSLKFLFFTALFLLIFFPGLKPSSLQAQTKVELNGNEKSVELSAANFKGKHIFYGIQKGNLSTPFWYQVEAPEGAKVIAYYSAGAKKDINSLSSNKGWIVLDAGNGKAKSHNLIAPEQTKNFTLKTETTSCSGMSSAELSQLASILKLLYPNQSWSEQEVCEWLKAQAGGVPAPAQTPGGAPIGDPLPTNPSFKIYSGGGVVYKNACGPKSNEYSVKVEVDLNGVSETVAQQVGNSLKVKFYAQEYKGCKAASIKPTSDGRFAPQPLLLMCTIGGSEEIILNKWKGNSPGKGTKVGVADYIYYRGNAFTRSPIGKILRGGKATFTVKNSNRSYGVCFRLARQRQKVNGYQGGD